MEDLLERDTGQYIAAYLRADLWSAPYEQAREKYLAGLGPFYGQFAATQPPVDLDERQREFTSFAPAVVVRAPYVSATSAARLDEVGRLWVDLATVVVQPASLDGQAGVVVGRRTVSFAKDRSAAADDPGARYWGERLRAAGGGGLRLFRGRGGGAADQGLPARRGRAGARLHRRARLPRARRGRLERQPGQPGVRGRPRRRPAEPERLSGRLDGAPGGHDDLVLTPDLTATAEGGFLVLRRRDGVEHSAFPVAALDALAHLEALAAGAAPPVRPWSEVEFDAALAREGWRRAGPWTAAEQGAVAPVVPTYLNGGDDHDG